jgi:serine/threonine-protein kinase
MGSHEVLAPGSVFAGSFRIVELLGDGEMGTTYLVDVLPRGRRCVLKAMVAGLVKQDAIRKTFATQAKSTSRVTSAHVLQTLDAGIDRRSGRPWFTTELLRGEDLASRVARWGSQALTEVRALVAALGDALGKAHAAGLVHYDLTPENIHLSAGKPFGVTLRELTISRLVSDACAAEGDIVGTAIWMAPEQFDLGRRLAPTANVWSLGLLAFYATTGKPYWLQATDDPAPSRALLREILLDPIAGASERAEALGCGVALPPWFDGWFGRCVTRDSGRRFRDATAATASFAESFATGPYDLSEDPDDDQRTTTRLPPKPPRVKGSRSLPRGIVAEARGEPVAVSPMAPSTTGASASTSAARTRRRSRRPLRHLAVLTAGAAALAWFWMSRHPGKQLASSPAAGSVSTTQSTTTLPAASPSATTEALTAGGGMTSPSDAVAVVPAAATHSESVGAVALAGKDVSGKTTDFDLAGALKALNGVYYGNCAVPAAGKLAVTFAPSGRVKQVTVLRGNYDEQATTCVAARFGGATVAPFRGGAQTVTAELVATR